MLKKNTMRQKLNQCKTLLKIFFKGKNQDFFVQFFRYCFVGGVAAVLDTGLVVYLTDYVKIYYIFSVIAGFIIGVTVNYLLSSLWVFHRELSSVSKKQHVIDISLFTFIGIIGLILTIIIIWVLFDLFSFSILISKLIAVAIVLSWNFLARKYFVFCKIGFLDNLLNK